MIVPFTHPHDRDGRDGPPGSPPRASEWSASSVFSTPETARKLADPTLPSNQLIERAGAGKTKRVSGVDIR